ncbi:vitamin K epoxide reductase family protein [Algoriphagus pacificus]|uniref:VKOR family protein n=1 Tax=Algoriphagus pacificus TaxID=2811234 RepID=A0ABS3CCH1_9BACT|nr:vitamin K epoxide reductase family protein [Algoriphagus pacificus]MBN7814697.1 VKOR family protein [Algoriphagus pacificus]
MVNVTFTKQFLKEKIFSHPQYPSLLCLTDTLEEYGIKTIPVSIGVERLIEIPLPAIVQVSNLNGSNFNIITSISKDKVTFYDENGRLKDLSSLEFQKNWTGVSLLIESLNGSRDPEIYNKVKTNRFIKSSFLIVCLSFLLLLIRSIIISEVSVLMLSYFLLKVLGISVSFILLWYQQDKENPSLKKFCTSSKNVDCNSILESKKFQWLDGGINLSLIVFSYFIAGLGSLIILNFSNITFLAWLSLVTFPVVILSFYFQAFVYKKWCKFCLLIQALLISECFFVAIGSFWKGDLNPDGGLLFLFLFVCVIIAGVLIKPMIRLQEQVFQSKRQLSKLKSNKELFQFSLSRSKKMINDSQGIGILLKGKNPKYDIIKVCNPYCGPCSLIHPELENLFDKGNINLQIIFSSSGGDERKEKTVQHLMAVDSKGSLDYMRSALDDWYGTERKDYNEFAIKYPIYEDLSKQKEKIIAMDQWCKQESILQTPTLFINGYELPSTYSISDLKYLLY